MALTAQHTQVWRARLEALTDFILPVFLQAITNSNYQGDLGANKTLNLVNYGSINISDYTGAALNYQTPATTGDTFSLDQLKYFAFLVDDKDQYGSLEPLINNFSTNAVRDMNIVKDTYLAGLHTNITTNLAGDDTTPLQVGFDEGAGDISPLKALKIMAQKMGQSNADMTAPNVILPMWYGMALAHELSNRSTVYGDAILKSSIAPGEVGALAGAGGFAKIFISNNVANTADAKYKIMAATPFHGITFAQGIDQVESDRHPDYMATYVRGLNYYGGKIVDQKHMGLLTANRGSWASGVAIEA